MTIAKQLEDVMKACRGKQSWTRKQTPLTNVFCVSSNTLIFKFAILNMPSLPSTV